MTAVAKKAENAPRVVLAGVGDANLRELQDSLGEENFEIFSVPEVGGLLDLLSDPLVAVVVLTDRFYKDLEGILREGKALGSAQWILYSANETTNFRAKLQALGVTLLFPYPVRAAQLAGRIRQCAKIEVARIAAHLRGEAPSPPPLEFAPAPDAAPVYLESNRTFAERRKWPAVDADEFSRFGQIFADRKRGFEAMLRDVWSESGCRGRLSLMSFGVESPLIDPRASRAVVIASSDEVGDLEFHLDLAKYPEVSQALFEASGVFVPDVTASKAHASQTNILNELGVRSVAAIPLFLGNNVFGAMLCRFENGERAHQVEFLQDLQGYSAKINLYAAHIDFFSRIYRTLKV